MSNVVSHLLKVMPEPGGWSRFVLTVRNLESLVTRLKEQGVLLRSDLIEGPGGRQVLCEDPSGNAVELFEPAQSS